jgi:multiple sugar transport system substrate-binding protein
MYDGLYDRIPEFERRSGLKVEVVVRLTHPELNAWVKQAFADGSADIDLLSTHTKYAPSQVQWLAPLDGLVSDLHVADLLARPAELSRIEGQLVQVPRNLDVRLLHYRRDWLGDNVPDTWTQLAEVAQSLTTDAAAGFLFPGRESGLFGTFYELLVGAGGELFDAQLRPAFDSPEGVWAVEFLTNLHLVKRVTPRELPGWHYDEISAEFRAGRAAMVCDWPGSYHLYRDPATCVAADRLGLAQLPAGPAGPRSAYAGCHSFAVPRSAANPEGGFALLRELTSVEAQVAEAQLGSIPCRRSALARIQQESQADSALAARWQLLARSEEAMIMPPRFAAYPGCEDAIWKAVQRAMTGDWSPRQAVARAAEDVREIVNKA